MASMPAWEEFTAPVLRSLIDGEVRPVREIRHLAGAEAQLTDEQRADLLPSGQLKHENRIGWAVSYLNRVGALDRPSRGQYRISDVGRELLQQHPDGITEMHLRAMARDDDVWWKTTKRPDLPLASEPESDTVLDPIEQVEAGISRIHAEVAADLLDRLHAQDPAFFEQAVLDLLMGMGYGGAEGTATRTQLSNDAGIDGIVDQDALGLSRIYVQAKRYGRDKAVGRPEIQAFVGALQGNQANQGVFITSGKFSTGARQYAENLPTRIILIDGDRLAGLMIRYGVGVQAKRTVQIVEVDEDFFE